MDDTSQSPVAELELEEDQTKDEGNESDSSQEEGAFMHKKESSVEVETIYCEKG